jgi:hypothetical protein
VSRGQHLKPYSVRPIMLRSLLHNAFLLSRIVIISDSYRSEHIGPVITFYSYCSDFIDKRYSICLLLLLGKIAFKSK